MPKRTIDSFFAPDSKKPRTSEGDSESVKAYSKHISYPFPIPDLLSSLGSAISNPPAIQPQAMTDKPDLDILYFQPYLPPSTSKALFSFLRSNLPFYRVEYDIQRGGISTHVRTPRFTTVFGLDATSIFDPSGTVVDSATSAAVPALPYEGVSPRPIPACLDALRRSAETATGCAFNFCLVNYYASGADSIAFHSDDERFLGLDPSIASFSLGARRDFVLKRKPVPRTAGGQAAAVPEIKQVKLPLGSGDMILMRGRTQAHWLHSVPKRGGKNEVDGGRINITFRRALVKGGTANYYHYNVGAGPVYRWDGPSREMALWEP